MPVIGDFGDYRLFSDCIVGFITQHYFGLLGVGKLPVPEQARHLSPAEERPVPRHTGHGRAVAFFANNFN
jgi:hypothetical protein